MNCFRSGQFNRKAVYCLALNYKKEKCERLKIKILIYHFHRPMMLWLMMKMDKTKRDYLKRVECDMHYQLRCQYHWCYPPNPNANLYRHGRTVIIWLAFHVAARGTDKQFWMISYIDSEFGQSLMKENHYLPMLLSVIQSFPVCIEVVEWQDSYQSYNVPINWQKFIDYIQYE